MPRRKTATLNQEEKLTVATNYPIGDPRRYGEAVENNQLSVFDYSSLDANTASLAKESAIEIKAREKAIWENIIAIGNKLIEVKNALPHGQFESWVKLEFQWSDRTARKYMTVSKELDSFRKDSSVFPNGFEPLYALASGLAKADEETKEQILDEVKEKTEEKGKALTEKEIKEIVREKLAKLRFILSNPREAVKYTNDDLANQFELPIEMVKQTREVFEFQRGEEFYKEQNKFYVEKNQEFHQQLEEKDNRLKELEDNQKNLDKQRLELIEKEKLVKLQQENLANTINTEVSEKIKTQLKIEQNKLDEERKKVEKELKKAKELARENEKIYSKLTNVNTWITSLENFTFNLSEDLTRLNRVILSLDKLPELNELEQSDSDVIKKRLLLIADKFDQVQYDYATSVQSISRKLKELNYDYVNKNIIEVYGREV